MQRGVPGTSLQHEFAGHLKEIDLTPKHLGVLSIVEQGEALGRLMRELTER